MQRPDWLGHGLVAGVKSKRNWELKKEKRERKYEVVEGSRRLWGKDFLLVLWPAVWIVERRLFRVKIKGSVLLDARNDSTMADLDFNYLICRSVVGKLNPKTLIKCFFS